MASLIQEKAMWCFGGSGVGIIGGSLNLLALDGINGFVINDVD